MTQNHRTWPALTIALIILSLALGMALVFGQDGSGRAPQNGSGRANSNKSPAKPTTPARKPTTTVRSPPATVRPQNSRIELVRIPSGSFMMGGDGFEDEKPVHSVTINYSFYMGKFEVTQAQWQAVMGTNPSKLKSCADCPVEQVSWDDVQEFIHKLNKLEAGFSYRLPTEAEWEYTCRAGATVDYGGPIAGPVNVHAWYDSISGDKTHPVGQKEANAFGLYDMLGNVWEWCEDWYNTSYDGAPVNGSAWLTGGEQKDRVLRGGAWSSSVSTLRFAHRGSAAPGTRDHDVGFRVVAIARTQ